MTKVKKRAMVLALTLALTWGTCLVAYASASAVLMSDETSKSTACVGNTSGKFYYWGNVASASSYNVQFVVYGGKNSSNCNTSLEKRVCAPGTTFDKTSVPADSSTYSVGKVTMYGNTVENPKKNCIAGVTINNS